MNNILKNFAWGLGCPFVFIWFVIKWFTTKLKARKYLKNPEDFLEQEKYEILYKIAKPTSYLLKLKISEIIKDFNIPKKVQLIIANHRSYIDLLILYVFLYEQLGTKFIFVAKKELADSKLGHILKLIDTIFIDRTNLRQMVSSINTQYDVMKTKGKSIVVFPEGTRNTKNELLEFKPGAFEIAYKTISPIQPILFLNTNAYWEDKKEFKKNKPEIIFKVINPFLPNKFLNIDRQILAKNIRNEMQKNINQLLTKKSK